MRVLGAHNLETRYTRHTCLLIDGVLALDAGSLASALTRAEMDRVKAVLLSHGHFDHVRDVPTLGLTTLENGVTVDIYGLSDTLDTLKERLMDGSFYPDFTKRPSPERPKFRYIPVVAGQAFQAQGYKATPLSVPHAAPCVGYVVDSSDGVRIAYTGDTGGNLSAFLRWHGLRLLAVETTFPNRFIERARQAGHLTPASLEAELAEALGKGLNLPRVMVVHMHTNWEEEIREELAAVADRLGVEITYGQEDMVVFL